MFCGSCMHDNTLAKALKDSGTEVTLIPTYTPIRVDEENQSVDEVFLGGINIYLDTQFRLWQSVPRFIKRIFDSPRVINFATRFGVSNDAHQLGKLTLAMLEGAAGPQHDEVEQLVNFIADRLKPDVILFSNALLVGVLQRLKERYSGKVYALLQGDDIFLESLQEPYKSQAISQIQSRSQQFDGFLVHSNYYRDFMSEYLQLPSERFHKVPLGIEFEGFADAPPPRSSKDDEPFTIGYLARLCPEKGLHVLVEAFSLLHQRQPTARLKVAGYVGYRDKVYVNKIMKQAKSLGDAFDYVGSPPDRTEKAEFLQSLNVLSVPTVYREPKGLFVLEALANGIPVVQPAHGSFPEILEAAGGGILHTPDDPASLADALEQLMLDRDRAHSLAVEGHAGVRKRFNCGTMAEKTLAVFTK